MSSDNEDAIVAPWVGSLSSKNVLTVVVVSTNVEIIERIAEALTDVHTKGTYKWKLITLRSFDLEKLVEVSNLTGKMGMDFVILAMDTNILFCLEWTKNALSQVDPDLRARRVVLVNAGGAPVNAMAVSASDLIAFSTEENLDMLSANVFVQHEALSLAQRLLRYMEVSIGVDTGVPNLNI
ncbi:PREDICTED: uncharacterized protein LOC106108760 [Papilio polytes]|uniref:uncharacterized protein LOC106108760 n=1 Tax=Papilio polytes TaxID=76194 RepID=UPI0006768B7E|nr:PREDICTED: uncharacterized protein LOC106108760 [Papilio polytes]